MKVLCCSPFFLSAGLLEFDLYMNTTMNHLIAHQPRGEKFYEIQLVLYQTFSCQNN